MKSNLVFTNLYKILERGTIKEEPNTVLELFDELKYFLMQEKLLEMSEDILLPVNH